MKNNVELIGYYGSDEIIACSAWTSTNRDLTEEKRNRIGKLIDYLWKNEHETPFEKATVHFLVNTDIATHIHLLKHRIASINGESGRYKELKEDKYYLPEDWKGVNLSEDLYLHDAHGDIKWEKGTDTWYTVLQEYVDIGNYLYHKALKDLTPVLGRKRAKESARFFKTYNSQIEADVMFNMRSFANFIKLRYSEHAQVEIMKVAEKMLHLVETIPDNPFKYTLETIKNKLGL